VAGVSFRGVTKRYGEVVAVDGLDLDVADGELLVLLGPSGCGKTTALRMVAGLEEVTEGTVVIGDHVVNDIDPRERDVAMVFQSYALYPHLTVAGNIEFPLRQRKIPRHQRQDQVTAAARTLGLEELLARKPGQLSGGQRQRVALARAIVREPQAFLMDEPLSNLDAALRVQTRADIVSLQRRLGTTTLYVTHDQVEAMTMAHRIAVMVEGRLQQVAPPTELYERPETVFVARFLGSPGMNVVPATLGTGSDGGVEAVTAAGPLALGRPLATPGNGAREVSVGFRPEHTRIDPEGPLEGTVILVELLGADVHVVCATPGGDHVIIRQASGIGIPGLGDSLRIAVDPGQVHVFRAADGHRAAVAT